MGKPYSTLDGVKSRWKPNLEFPNFVGGRKKSRELMVHLMEIFSIQFKHIYVLNMVKSPSIVFKNVFQVSRNAVS